MVLTIPPAEWKKLTHKERRRLIDRERKRRRRTAAALQRKKEEEVEETAQEEHSSILIIEERQREKEEAERQLQHEAWVQRERIAQEEFRKKREEEERKLREREERERLIREEWEAMERREKEAEERREKAKMDKEALLQQALNTIDDIMEDAGMQPWHNPLAPPEEPIPVPPATPLHNTDYGTEKDAVNCPFYLKVGACRFGERCSRRHPVPSSSSTLLIRGMCAHLGFAGRLPVDEHDLDLSLELDEREMYQNFVEFYNDVFPEFEKAGKIVQFKVSCNHEPHLRGNVYVQYSNEDECKEALRLFNGRWYAGRQLSCEFCPVLKWRLAICGLYERNRCPKGKHCNFLHVFRNPRGAFSWADRDLPPPRSETDSSEHRNRHRWRSPLHERSDEWSHDWSHERSHDHRPRHRRGERRRKTSHGRSPRERSRTHSIDKDRDNSPELSSSPSSHNGRNLHRNRDRKKSPLRESKSKKSHSSGKRKKRTHSEGCAEDGSAVKHSKHKKHHHSHHKHHHHHSTSEDRHNGAGVECSTKTAHSGGDNGGELTESSVAQEEEEEEVAEEEEVMADDEPVAEKGVLGSSVTAN